MTHTFIPEYEITQRVTAIRLPNPQHDLTGVSGNRAQTIRPSSLRFITDGDAYRVEATGRKVLEDGSLSSVLYTVTCSTHEGEAVVSAPEWVLAVLDGIR